MMFRRAGQTSRTLSNSSSSLSLFTGTQRQQPAFGGVAMMMFSTAAPPAAALASSPPSTISSSSSFRRQQQCHISQQQHEGSTKFQFLLPQSCKIQSSVRFWSQTYRVQQEKVREQRRQEMARQTQLRGGASSAPAAVKSGNKKTAATSASPSAPTKKKVHAPHAVHRHCNAPVVTAKAVAAATKSKTTTTFQKPSSFILPQELEVPTATGGEYDSNTAAVMAEHYRDMLSAASVNQQKQHVNGKNGKKKATA